jgi:hypothetical protein
MMEQIKKDGINTKEFRSIMKTYNKSIKDAAKVNINQTKITKNFYNKKNINTPYKKEECIHQSEKEQFSRVYHEEMYLCGSWRNAVHVTIPDSQEKPDNYDMWRTV